MKILRVLVSSVLLVSLLPEATASNPDAEIFQDPSNDDNKKNPKRSAPMVTFDSQSGTDSKEPEVFRISSIKQLSQIRPGAILVMWRPYYPPLTSRNYNYRNRRPDLVVTSDDKPARNSDRKDPVNSNGPDIPVASFSGSQPSSAYMPENSNVKTISSGDELPGNSSPHSTNNMNAQNDNPISSNIPSTSATDNGYGTRISNPNEPNKPRDRNVPDVRATSIPLRRRPAFSVLLDTASNSETGSDDSNNDFVPKRREGAQPSVRPAYDDGGSPVNPPEGYTSKPIGLRPVHFPTDVPNPNNRISPDSNFFAGIINDFAFKLGNRLNQENNFVISPLSIFIALSMCYLGSDGSTKTQMEDVLGLNKNAVHGPKLHQGVHDLESLITSPSSAYQLFLANGMFPSKDVSIREEFKRDIKTYYSADLKSLDFYDPDVSVPVINKWVSKNTRNMIKSFFDSPPDPETQLLILNAIYFKGIWKTQFPVQSTYDGYFFPAGGSTKRVPTMELSNLSFPYYRSEDLKHTFLKLPYDGDQISMIIALPYNFGDTPMPSMDNQIMSSIRNSMADTRMDTIGIPKFKFQHTVQLEEPLKQLGIRDLFIRGLSNLSKMMHEPGYVSNVTHKAVIEVNERGTKASAITGVVRMPLTLMNTTDFIANRPFAFYIVHESSGLVLFNGKVNDIEEETREGAPPTNSPRRNGPQWRWATSGSHG